MTDETPSSRNAAAAPERVLDDTSAGFGPVDGSLCDRGNLPLAALVPMLAREAIRPKAIYQTHRWFARRLGTAFRAMLIGSEVTTEREFWRNFYGANRASRGQLLDPFVGGGTSVIEGLRLGYHCQGFDIDPAAAAVSQFGTRVAYLDDLKPALAEVTQEMRKELAPYYGFRGDWSGVVPIHFFWVQVAQCPHCGHRVECHPSLQLAASADQKQQWVLDTENNRILELPLCRRRLPNGSAIDSSPVALGKLTCPFCDERTALIDLAGPPTWRLFAIEETHEIKDGRVTPNSARTFRLADDIDQARVLRSRRRFQKLDSDGFIPSDAIPEFPSGDKRLHSYGYQNFRDLFNERQLLHLGLLARRIKAMPEHLREPFAIAFSDHLTTNCMLTNYAGGWRRLAPLFSIRAYRHICRPVELNPWLDGTGRGTFPNAIKSIVRAQKSFLRPSEPTADGGFRPTSFDRQIGAATRVSIQVRDSRDLQPIDDRSVDVVLSDPPYFDNIAYAELSAFFKPWMKLLGLIAPNSTVIDLDTLGGARRAEGTAAKFQAGLGLCMDEIARVLKPQGRLIFTFQNGAAPAWDSLGQALIKAGLEVVNVFPLLGESANRLHKHPNSISWDAVLVCRTRSGALKHIAGKKQTWVKAQTARWQKKLAAIKTAAFSPADSANLEHALGVQWESRQQG